MSGSQQGGGQGFAPGQLWRRIRAVSAEALAHGALVSIATEPEVLAEGGVAFQVRVADGLRRKDAQRPAALPSALQPDARGGASDPFLTYDRELFVGNIGAGHVGLLNKYNVLDNHLLVVTRDFEDQRDLLTQADFAALWTCLREIDGLGFYNGGEEAGASQSHKHLQLVVLPWADSEPRIPMEAVFDPARFHDGVVASPALGFPHGLVRLGRDLMSSSADGDGAATALHGWYLALLAHVGLTTRAGERRQPGPYNLLVTRRWILLVPRVEEHFEGVSLNGLAFAGSLFVRDRAQLRTLRKAGPMHALAAVSGVAR